MTESPEILEARKKVKQAKNPENSFASGFTGGYDLESFEGVNAWLTTSLFGLAVAETISDPEDARRWAITRKAMEGGLGEIDNALNAYKEQGELENFTQTEANEIRELLKRKKLLMRDAEVVVDKYNGDTDVPIDIEDNSFNKRWGLETEDGEHVAGVSDLVKAVADNPVHASGIIASEVVKDLPLGVLGALGLGAKGAKGASLISQIHSKLNAVKPKALRGLVKVATPVGVGAISGGAYEASYSALNEGKIKWKDVETGTEFGAAFGLLAGSGVLAKDIISSAVKRRAKPLSEKEPVLSVNEQINATVSDKDMDDVREFSTRLRGEDNDLVFGEIDPESFHVKSYDDAVSEGLIKKGFKEDKPAWHDYNKETGHSTIFWNEKAFKDTTKRLTENWDKHTSDLGTLGGFKGVTPNMLKYLKDEDTLAVFTLAHEKAHIFQRQQGYMFKPHAEDVNYNKGASGSFERERQANHMAMQELDRLYKEHQYSKANKSDAQAEADKLIPKNYRKEQEDLAEEVITPVDDGGNAFVSWAEKNPIKTAVGASVGAYGLASEDDAGYAALVTGAVALGGPRAYRALAKSSIPQVSAKARHQLAKGNEAWAIYAKQLDVRGQELSDIISKTFRTEEEGLRFIEALEGGDPSSIDPALLKEWKQWHSFLAKQGASVGMFEVKHQGTVKTQLVSNYVSHIVRGKIDPKTKKTIPLTPQERKELTDKLSESLGKMNIKGAVTNGHQIPRKIMGDMKDLIKDNYDVVTNPAEILAIYTQAMSRTIHNRKLVDEFKKLDLKQDPKGNSLNAIMSKKEFDRKVEKGELTSKEHSLYEESIHPSLKDYRIHAHVRDMIDDHFQIKAEGGLKDVAESILSLNNSLKRVFVFGSLFHAQALLMSGVYSLGVTGAIKGLLGKGKLGKNNVWQELDLESGSFKHMAKEALRDGLQILQVKRQGLVNPGKEEIDRLFDKLGSVGATGKKGFDKLDEITWEFMHDRYKLASYLRHKEVLMKKGMDDATAGRKAAEFTNDAFGSLDWNNFATKLYKYASENPNRLRGKAADKVARLLSPNKRRWLNLALFAPDWTVSNLRIIGKTFTDLPEVSDAFLNGIIRGKNWDKKEAKEIISAYRMYADYTARAGVYTSAMWWLFSEAFSDKAPSMEGLEDFWFGDNSGKLDLGNGRGMVLSKQVAEPFHFIQYPMHTLLNKMSIVPKTIMEGLTNKQWISMKKYSPHGPAIIDPTTGESHVFKWIAGKLVPISTKPLTDESLSMSQRLGSAATGAVGFPQYRISDVPD
jgi:hypothetical protein